MTPRPPLLVNVADVLRHLGVQNDVQRTVQLPGLAVIASRVPDGADIELQATVESTASGAVNVHGVVTAPWVGECRRCLRSVEGVLGADVQEVFDRRPIDGETYPMKDEQIDLEPMVRDAVLLALPLAPLCEDGCLGPDPEEFPVEKAADPVPIDELAPEDRPVDPRWAALDQLSDSDN